MPQSTGRISALSHLPWEFELAEPELSSFPEVAEFEQPSPRKTRETNTTSCPDSLKAKPKQGLLGGSWYVITQL